jgi:hypothetical protein
MGSAFTHTQTILNTKKAIFFIGVQLEIEWEEWYLIILMVFSVVTAETAINQFSVETGEV